MKRLVFMYTPSLAFGLALLMMVALGWTLFKAEIASIESVRSVQHTLKVISETRAVNEHLSRAESAQRGFLLSGKETFLFSRDDSYVRANDAVLRLKRLTSDNPQQQRQMPALAGLLVQRYALMQHNTKLRQSGIIEAVANASTESAQNVSAQLYDLTGVIEKEARQLLEIRRADDHLRREAMVKALIVAGLISLLVLVPGYIGFIWQARARAGAEGKLAAMAESLPGTVYQFRSNPDGSEQYEFISSSVAQVLGIDRDDVLQDSEQIWSRVFDEDKPGLLASIKKATDSLEPQQHEFRIKHPDGSIKWLSNSASLEKKADGSILWSGYCADVTKSKQSEDALRKSEEYNRSIVESSEDCLKVLSLDGHLLHMAAPGCRIMRVTNFDDIRNADWFSFWEGEGRTAAQQAVAAARDGGTARFGGFCPLLDGTPAWWEVVVSPILGQNGKPERLLAVSREVTLQHQAEEDIRQLNADLNREKLDAVTANRAKSVFLANMSHEIRTPMNGVLGMLELLSLSNLNGAQRISLDVVRESGKSLLRIIDDILDFSKIEAGKLDVFPDVVSIAAVIAAVCNLYSSNASRKGLLIRSSVDPAISPALLVDPMRLRQILNNVISNALKFTTKGHIDIKAELIGRTEGEDRVRFSVKDTGIGISPEDQTRLFQPFVQASGHVASQLGGTGLGLAICWRLTQMMGGSLEMVSAIGTGTTMILELSLPIADAKDLVKVDPPTIQDLSRTTFGMRRMAPTIAQAEAEGSLLLLVEDHPVNRLLLLNQVNTLGYAAEIAENGVEALAMWKSGRYGIIITDCNMPLMDGYALTQAIRKIESTNGWTRFPIIACTADALAGEAEICFNAGMDSYLTKPLELKDLAKMLDQWLPVVHPGAPIDHAVLAAHSYGDAATERKILTYFQQVNDEDAVLLQRAVDGVDIPQIASVSHRIEGASRSIGANALADVCKRLEHAGRSNDWKAIQANMGAFLQELERLNVYCAQEKEGI